MKRIFWAALLIPFALSCATTLPPAEWKALQEDLRFWNWDDAPGGPYRVHYIEAGEGENHVLLIHGVGAGTHSWMHTVQPLVDAGYHVWAYDLVGFGYSSKPPDAPYGSQLLVRQVVDFMDGMGIETAHIVGNSLGGTAAIGVGLFLPQRARSLTVVDGPAYNFDFPLLLKLGRCCAELGDGRVTRDLTRALLEEVYYDPQRISEEMLDAYYLPFRVEGATEALQALLEGMNAEELDVLSQWYWTFEIPVLVIWGEQDTWVPWQMGARLAGALPNARFEKLRATGHSPQEERPQEFNALLLGFLNGLQKESSAN